MVSNKRLKRLFFNKTGGVRITSYNVCYTKLLRSDKSVILNTGSELNGRVKVLEGWVPDTQKGEVEAFLESEGVFYMHEEVNSYNFV